MVVFMKHRKNNPESKKIKRSRTGLPILESDTDFLNVFSGKNQTEKSSGKEEKIQQHDKTSGSVPEKTSNEDPEEDFASLLEEYSQKNRPRFRPKQNVSLKKRLKRYPGAELDLDLHGMTAIPARMKLRSFIHTCKTRGFFTVRIIVGKGLHSSEGPVLPDMAEDEIRELQAQGQVLWYEWEKKKKKESGSMIVYLKQFERFDP